MYSPILSQPVDTAMADSDDKFTYDSLGYVMRLPTAEIAEFQIQFAANQEDSEFAEVWLEESEYHEMMSEVGPEWFFEEL
jgi:hypothetical protein